MRPTNGPQSDSLEEKAINKYDKDGSQEERCNSLYKYNE